ncbi:MBL fold metallo-hydrolase [Haloarchaeobius sp. DYHT-AS-18]|uniref:MBL fold metallo-hydrolase n=1 Tax=Haloarchaeobius sp. DYHT-AS-18 TaxID=3446117 RepID=UPI003EBEAC88
MKITEGVHALPLTLEVQDQELTISPAAVETDCGLILVDTGLPPTVDQLDAALAAAGFDWDDIWAVLLTHQDVDHAGGLTAVIEHADPVVFAHRECAPYVDGREHPIKLDDERYPPVPVDVELSDGDRFRTTAGPMAVVFTPGHAPGHISLYFEEASLLLSADALHAPDGDIDGPRVPLDEDLAVDSIETLSEFSFERTLCYHGGFVEDGTGAVEAVLGERED